MEMIQYKPWEKEEVNSLVNQSNEKLPILDIQLGGACNLKCIYCDTPKYGFPCSVNLSSGTSVTLLNQKHINIDNICFRIQKSNDKGFFRSMCPQNGEYILELPYDSPRGA